jgi:hypothetical protein
MAEEDSDKTTQRLQNKVDKMKTLSMASNIHNLTPPIKKEDETQTQITIIESLKAKPRLKELFLRAQGLMYDDKEKRVIRVSKPKMNVEGAAKLVDVCTVIAEEAEWGNFDEEQIPGMMRHFFNINYPNFTFWHKKYELDRMDFNFVETTLQMFIVSSFSKGKRGKYINLLGKTYSEEFLGKILADAEKKEKERRGWNPFRSANQ